MQFKWARRARKVGLSGFSPCLVLSCLSLSLSPWPCMTKSAEGVGWLPLTLLLLRSLPPFPPSFLPRRNLKSEMGSGSVVTWSASGPASVRRPVRRLSQASLYLSLRSVSLKEAPSGFIVFNGLTFIRPFFCEKCGNSTGWTDQLNLNR